MSAQLIGVTVGSAQFTAISVSSHANTRTGDTIVAIVFRDEGYGTQSWTGTPFGLLGQLAAGTAAATGGLVQVWTGTASADGATAYTENDNSGNSTGMCWMFTIRGGGTPVMATQNNTTSSTNAVAPAVGSGVVPLLLMAWAARVNGGSRTWTKPTGSISAGAINPTGKYIIGFAADQANVTAGAQTALLDVAASTLAVAVAIPNAGSSTSTSWSVTASDSAPASDSVAVSSTGTPPVVVTPGAPQAGPNRVPVSPVTGGFRLRTNPARLSVLLAITQTGQVVGELPWTGLQFSDALDWSSSASATVTLAMRGADPLGRIDRAVLGQLRRQGPMFSVVIVREYPNGSGQRALWAGPVNTVHTAADLQVVCQDISKVFDGRLVAEPQFVLSPFLSTFAYQKAPWDLVNTLLSIGITDIPGMVGRALPLSLPPQSNIGGSQVIYKGSDLATVFERVAEQVHADGGPDAWIQPAINADGSVLSWNALIGRPRLGALTPTAWIDVDASISELDEDCDFSQLTTTGFLPGNPSALGIGSAGTADPRLLGSASVSVTSPQLAFERVDRQQVSNNNLQQLNALAQSWLNIYSKPVVTWTVQAELDLPPFYGDDFTMGDALGVTVSNHPVIEDGNYIGRLLGFSSDDRVIRYQVSNPMQVNV